MNIFELVQSIFIYAILNSLLVKGAKDVTSTIIHEDRRKRKIHRFFGLGYTFLFSIGWGFFLEGLEIWQKLTIGGLAISLTSVVVYKIALQSIMEIIPNVVKGINGIITKVLKND